MSQRTDIEIRLRSVLRQVLMFAIDSVPWPERCFNTVDDIRAWAYSEAYQILGPEELPERYDPPDTDWDIYQYLRAMRGRVAETSVRIDYKRYVLIVEYNGPVADLEALPGVVLAVECAASSNVYSVAVDYDADIHKVAGSIEKLKEENG